jgi:hypothetical protein
MPIQWIPSNHPEIGEPTTNDKGMAAMKIGDRLRAVLIDEPMGQVDDDAGKKTSLGQSQEKPHSVELVRRSDERHGDGDQPPGKHDACNPAARAPALHDHTAWNFQEGVAEEEDARAQPHHAIAEPEIVRHLQRRGGNIHAVEKRDHVKEKKIGQQAQGDAVAGTVAEMGRGDGRGHAASVGQPAQPCRREQR